MMAFLILITFWNQLQILSSLADADVPQILQSWL